MSEELLHLLGTVTFNTQVDPLQNYPNSNESFAIVNLGAEIQLEVRGLLDPAVQ